MTDVPRELGVVEQILLGFLVCMTATLAALFVMIAVIGRTNVHDLSDPAHLAVGESKEIVCFSSVPLKYKLKDENQPPFRYRLDGDTLYIDGGDLGFSITKLSPGTVCFFDANVRDTPAEPERDTSKDREA